MEVIYNLVLFYIITENLIEKGTEASLAACTFPGFGTQDCDHSEEVGVVCHEGNSLI